MCNDDCWAVLAVCFQAFAVTFTQNDLNLFKHSLETLKELNAKRKLFSKVRACIYISCAADKC